MQRKFLIALLGGIGAVYLSVQFFQYRASDRAIRDMAAENFALETENQWHWVRALEGATGTAMLHSMQMGEMAQVHAMLDQQREVKGVQEISFYGIRGTVALSTDRANIKKPLPEELREQLLTEPVEIKRQTETSFEIYKSMPVTTGCLECHSNFKNRKVGGVMAFRYSTESLQQAHAQWEAVATTVSEQNKWNAAITSAVLIVIVSGLVWVLIRVLVTKPLIVVTEHLTANSRQVRQVADSIAQASAVIADGASEQAAALEESSASLLQMTTTAHENSHAATGVETCMRDEVAPNLQKIHELTERVQKTLCESVAAGARTTEVIKVIDEIAFQTNILALNAAVEAARAGDAGLGFAVVATEVRNLAQRCSEAAHHTQELVENSHKHLSATATDFARVSEAIQESTVLGGKVSRLMAGISSASREQAQGCEQISGAVSQIDAVTQANAANAEQNAAASIELNGEAEALGRAVTSLLVLLGLDAKKCGVHSATKPPTHLAVPPAQPAKHELAMR